MHGGGGSGGKSVLAFGCSGVIPAGGGTSLRYGTTEAVTGALPTAGLTSAHIVAPYSGVLRNLYARASATPGAGVTVRNTVYINEVATAVLADIVDPAQEGNSGALEVAVAAGQRIAIGMTRQVGVPAGVTYGHTLELVAA